MPTVTDSLFVYGPWAPGNSLFWKFEPHIVRVHAATVRGSLYRSQLGFPLFVNEGRDQIRGSYLELNAPYVGKRVLQVPCVVDNSVKTAKIFAYLPEQIPSPRQRIPYGDWELDQKRRPSHLNGLSDEERACLLQLSATDDATLDPLAYRQLLKLGLLQDSGYGLGLSRLGKAAANYLEEASCPISH